MQEEVQELHCRAMHAFSRMQEVQCNAGGALHLVQYVAGVHYNAGGATQRGVEDYAEVALQSNPGVHFNAGGSEQRRRGAGGLERTVLSMPP